MTEKLTRSNAMAAKCHQCSGEYFDGKSDCNVPVCPLYNWMPYKALKPDFSWLKYNPRKKGLVTWEDSQREMSDEQRSALGERLKRMRTKNENVNDENGETSE